uniref:Putative transporter abc superfamily breast cancer resistance protein n=1 Tax=Lutzomyia longipalpis TaxID=7200 RepID=A0A1B0GHE1_LUTLO
MTRVVRPDRARSFRCLTTCTVETLSRPLVGSSKIITDRMFKRVDFPAPDGPTMAERRPALKLPRRFFKIQFLPAVEELGEENHPPHQDGDELLGLSMKNLRGSFNAGRLSAIVGPSGAGKSTLLNILSGLKKPSNESILLINGEKVNQSFIRKNSAYIAQDITFLGKLTTRETLEYAAKFKLPTNTSKIARLTIVEDIVQLLGMEKCLHNHVEKLSGGERKRLAIGEELITNPPVMIFDEPTSGLDTSMQDVSLPLLDHPGAGKSTLLNILSGLKKPSNESILLINGEKVNQSFIRKNSAYIAQDITFLGKLTTRETLEYAAKFKLPTNTSKIARLTIVEDIVQLLGMEKCLHNHAEKLSGGERKRLAIDSVSTVQVVRHLKDLARSGRTVICVIHQPSSFVLELFDDIYVLSDGQCLYNGSVEDIVPRFQEAGFLCPQYYNRADFILEVASQQRQGNRELLLVKARDGVKTQQSIANSLNSLNINTNEVTPDGSKDDLQLIESFSHPLSQWKQFCILLSRAFLCNHREPIVTRLKLLIHVLAGILFGLTYYDIGGDAARIQPNICLFFILMSLTFFGNAIPIILLCKEFLNNRYTFFPYFYAKILADLPILLICSFATLIPAYYMSGQPTASYRVFFVSALIILLTVKAFFCGCAVGIVFGVQMGIFIVPVVSLLMVMYSGFLIRYSLLPFYLKPLSYASFMRYYFEGILQAVYGFDREDLTCDGISCYFKSPKKILENFDIEETSYVWNFVGIFIWIVVLKLITIIALRRQVKRINGKWLGSSLGIVKRAGSEKKGEKTTIGVDDVGMSPKDS